MRWNELLQDQTLHNLPYKVELNAWGEIVMSPRSNKLVRFQTEIAMILQSHGARGQTLIKCAIGTEDEVNVPDVAWCSEEFVRKYGDITPFSEAPEICVEIVVPVELIRQMPQKMRYYFGLGAKECWLVNESGQVRFFVPEGERETSSFGVDVTLT